jgi:hypothetical protein
MAPTTQSSVQSDVPVRPDAAGPSVLAFRPDPATWLAELDRAPRSCRQAAIGERTGERRSERALRPSGGVRFVVLVGLMVVMAMAWSIAGWVAGPGSGIDPVGAGTTPEAQTIVVVQPGDTLWSIAAELEPDGDLRATVDRLADRNGGSTLTVGQRLVVSE